MPNSAEALRRWWGAFCLAVAAVMLIWGQTVLVPYLKGLIFIIYWFICFLFTIGAIFIALIDLRAIRQRVRNEHTELIEKTLREIDESKEKE
jgi:hypothetical protein